VSIWFTVALSLDKWYKRESLASTRTTTSVDARLVRFPGGGHVLSLVYVPPVMVIRPFSLAGCRALSAQPRALSLPPPSSYLPGMPLRFLHCRSLLRAAHAITRTLRLPSRAGEQPKYLLSAQCLPLSPAHEAMSKKGQQFAGKQFKLHLRCLVRDSRSQMCASFNGC
jgi:hypothetical protein